MLCHSVDLYDTKQFVGELKVEKITIAAENECYYNMFNEATRLLIKILSSGKQIRSATVFGITVAAHKHEFARLLTLKIDLMQQVCRFERCPALYPFTDLFNNIIKTLDF